MPGSTDAALYSTVPAGAFTVQITGKNATAGVALAELYEAGPPPTDGAKPRVSNFSVRTRAGSGDETLIVGFNLTGENTRNLVIRAVGPGLDRFGVTGTLPDPVLTVFRSARSVASNDDWAMTSEVRLTMLAAFETVGAFPLESFQSGTISTSSKDAALLISLAPGSYTAQVSGKSGANGIVLVEVYEVP